MRAIVETVAGNIPSHTVQYGLAQEDAARQVRILTIIFISVAAASFGLSIVVILSKWWRSLPVAAAIFLFTGVGLVLLRGRKINAARV